MDTLINILTCLEVIAFITSIFYWKKIKKTHWKWFSFYLLFIVISECIGWVLSEKNAQTANIEFYNILVIPVEYIFFIWLFHITFKKTNLKWLPIACFGIYLSSWLIDIFTHSGAKPVFYSSSFTVGNLILLVLVLGFFIQLATSNAILTFRRNMLFWVSLGILLYYLGAFPYYGLRNVLAREFQEVYMTYTYIVYVLDCFMYVMFTISFIWGKPNISSSSS
ncbi:MAG: hypothetical protein K0Q79_1374 [Flavipsychrobacter sp.]|nr:hypothetical protein [Flavipsychrobacter sp.]